jgi:nicotinamide mononucleotide transporter
MSQLEIISNIFNLAAVWLARKNSVHNWWVGIIGSILYGIMFYEAKLYADVALQIFFVLTSIYGFYLWKNGGTNNTELPIAKYHFAKHALLSLAALAATAGYGALLHYFTDASYPFVDSTVLMFSILAQFLLMARVLSNWNFWILVNLISIALYWSKDLKLTSFVYLIFLINALFGLQTWKKLYDQQKI